MRFGAAESNSLKSRTSALGSFLPQAGITALAADANLGSAVSSTALHADPLLQEASLGLGKSLSHTGAPT